MFEQVMELIEVGVRGFIAYLQRVPGEFDEFKKKT
jgi:hypothetical protein